MNAPLVYAVVLILVELATLASVVLWHTRAPSAVADVALFTLAILGITVTGARRRAPWRRTDGLRAAIGVLVAALFLAKAKLSPLPYNSLGFMMYYPMSYAIAQGLLVVQALHLHYYRRDGLPAVMALLGMASIVFAGNAFTRAVPDVVLQILAMVFSLAFVGYLSCYRKRHARLVPGRSRLAVVGGVALVALVFSVGTTGLLTRYRAYVEQFLLRLQLDSATVSSVGFSRNSRLYSVTRLHEIDGDKVALRVYCDGEPGYLRGAVFTTFEDRGWRSVASAHKLEEVSALPGGLKASPLTKCFLFGPQVAGDYHTVQIWATRRDENLLFAPLGARAILTSGHEVVADDNDAVEVHGADGASPYTVALPVRADAVPRQTLTVEQRAVLLRMPADLDPRIPALAREITAGCATSAEKAAAVTRFLSQRFSYSRRIAAPRGLDPLAHFLFTGRKGHCEYFATAAAMLLRAVDVPTRYVTGYYVSEWNPYGEYWVARNSNAHAWVEAYDEARGWVTVEATPAMGLPRPGPASRLKGLVDAALQQMRMMRVALRDGSWKAVLAEYLVRLRWAVAGLFTLPVLLVLGAAAVACAVVLHHRNRDKLLRTTPPPAPFRPLVRLLAELERRLRTVGLERAPEESLRALGSRVAALDGRAPWCGAVMMWLSAYERARFGDAPSPEQVEALRRTLPDVTEDRGQRTLNRLRLAGGPPPPGPPGRP